MQRNSFRTTLCRTCIFLVCAMVLYIPVTALDLGSAPGSATSTISNGDSVSLRGIATGHPREGLQVWVIGHNYLRISTIPVNADNTYEFEIRPSDTLNLAPGQYYVVVQHPMMNGQFDIWYDASTGRVLNRQLGSGGLGIFQMSGSGSLQGPDSAHALVSAISSQNVDDSFVTYTFTIVPPSAFIQPVPDHAVGDKFTITGSTNLAVGDNLMIEITSSSFRPTRKTAAGGFSGANGMVTVVPGNGGYNRWSFDVDSSAFQPDEYIVKVSGVTIDVTATTTFNILERLPEAPAVPSPLPTTIQETLPTAVPVTSLPAPTPAKTPLSLGSVAAAGLLAVLGKRTCR